MTTHVLKCINLNENSSLKYSLSVNFKKNIWLISVKDIAYENKATANLSAFAYIRCNLIHDLRVHEASTQSFWPPIGTVLLKANAREKRITYFEETWFQINAPNDVLILQFVDPTHETPLNLNCDIFITLLLKQLK